MFLSKQINQSWLSAFSKSFLVVFVLQIFLSAACISTAEAETAIHVAPVTAHCNNVPMSDTDIDQQTACTHCDTPDSALSSHTVTLSDVTTVLLALIVLPHVPELSSVQRMDAVEGYAPPHSSTLLYQTTRRILI